MKKPISTQSVEQTTPHTYRPKTSQIMEIKSRLVKLKKQTELLINDSENTPSRKEAPNFNQV